MSDSMNWNWLKDNPDYINILQTALEHQLSKDEKTTRIAENYERDIRTYWENTDVKAHPTKLYQLETHGFLERVFDSQSSTKYVIPDEEEVKSKLEEISGRYDGDERVVMHDFPSEEDLEEMGIFDDVVGFEDVKFLLRRAMSSDDIVNIALFGPSGSAKTVFLMCINSLEDSEYVSGSPTTESGFYDVMFEEEPRYVAIDELDNMDKDDQKALADYTSEGILVETKGNNKKRKMRTNTHTFAAANRPDDVLEEIENRFIDLHFDPYTYDEFVEVCEHILPKNEGKSEEEARMIAEAVWDIEGEGNVRKAIQASRLSRDDPKKVLKVLDDYSSARLR